MQRNLIDQKLQKSAVCFDIIQCSNPIHLYLFIFSKMCQSMAFELRETTCLSLLKKSESRFRNLTGRKGQRCYEFRLISICELIDIENNSSEFFRQVPIWFYSVGWIIVWSFFDFSPYQSWLASKMRWKPPKTVFWPNCYLNIMYLSRYALDFFPSRSMYTKCLHQKVNYCRWHLLFVWLLRFLTNFFISR